MKLDPFRWWRLLRGKGEKAQPHRKITGMSMQSPAFIASHTHFWGWVVRGEGCWDIEYQKAVFGLSAASVPAIEIKIKRRRFC